MSAIRDEIVDANGFAFRVHAAGSPDAPLVLLLHGFPQSRHSWREQLPALADAGYFAVAPDQRGYSPGARPPAVADYRTPLLMADALALADALCAERFHLAGHDWGGQLAWLLAGQQPERVRSLSVLSRPHPAAFARAFKGDPDQAHRSRHHRAFLDPDTAGLLLADDARRLRRNLRDQGVPETGIAGYLEVLGEPAALEAALNWYRAPHDDRSGLTRADAPPVSVPVLYIWGDGDATVGRFAAEATADFVTGPFRFEELPGVGHFVTDQAADAVNRLLLDFLGAPA